MRRGGIRQLIKFCIVGFSSTIVDKGSLWLLLKYALPQAPWWLSATISFCLGVTNGFTWNRLWTFRARGHASVHSQYSKFVLTNIVGLFLNLALTKVFLVLITGQVTHDQNPAPVVVIIASLCAVPIVVIWNFAAAKYWTFRAPDAIAPHEEAPNQAA